MSIQVLTDVKCDCCARVAQGVTNDSLLINAARSLARKHGWIFHNGQDFCPSCWLNVRKTVPRGRPYLKREKLSSLEDVTKVCRMIIDEEQPTVWVASELLVNVTKIHAIIKEYGDDYRAGRDLTKPKGEG
jgi:hypothetical protein